MPLPLLPIALGLAGTAAGAALHAWITGESPDAWTDKDVFNARMRDMQGLAMALNTGFAGCKPFMSSTAQLTAWRAARDGFSKFYGSVGSLYFDPSPEKVEQAKGYASKFYFWTGEYNRLKCGGKLTPTNTNGGSKPSPSLFDDPAPAPSVPVTDWLSIVKWTVGGLAGLYVLKTLNEIYGKGR